MYISNPFNFQPSVEIKSFCTCHIHSCSGKACFCSHGRHMCVPGGRVRGLRLNGFSMWAIVVVRKASHSSLRFLSLPEPSICSEAELGQPVAHPTSARKAPSPTSSESVEKKRKRGERGRKRDVDTCSEEAKEFCLLLGDISAFCCGKDLLLLHC